MRPFLILLAALSAPFLLLRLDAVEIHVSPDGDDAGPGDRDTPFRTLERARDALREQRDAGAAGETAARVVLHPGRYPREETFELGAADSGRPGAPVVYEAAVPGRAVFDGGHVLAPAAFEPVTEAGVLARLPESARDGVLRVDLRELGISEYGEYGPRGWARPDIPAPMELILDGLPQNVARWPNEGSIPLGEVFQGQDGDEPGIFEYNTGRAERWTDAGDFFISGLFGVSWAHDTVGVESIDTGAGTLTTSDSHDAGFNQPGYLGIQTHYYAVNLLEEIDRPGEYYIDRDGGVLYFLPPYPLDHSLIQLSRLADPLVRFDGASHIHLRGLVFENARAGGVRIDGGEGVRIGGCTFRALGMQGAVVSGGRNHGLSGCDIHHVGGGGLSIGGGNRKTLEPSGHFVRNCDIHSYNRWIRYYNPAVIASGVGTTIANNHMHRALHQGITFSGNEHVIEFNEIHDVLNDISDMGSIYIGRNPTFAGNVIRHNFFHHLSDHQDGGSGVQAIFFDDDTIYVAEVFGNVFYRTGSTGVIKFHGGGGASIANNISIRSPKLVQDGPGHIEGIERAISKMLTDEPHGHGFPRMIEEMNIDEAPYRSRYPYLYDTFAEGYNEGTPRWNNYEAGEDLSQFVDPDNLDFRLKDDSPVLDRVAEDVHDRVYGADGEEIPFRDIPFERIGLRRDEHRRELGPAPFSKLGPSAGGDTGAENPLLWWSPSHNADKYRLTVARDPEMNERVVDKNVPDNRARIEALEPGTYYWQVEARVDRSRSNRGTRTADGDPRPFRVSGARE